ncbi:MULTISPECIES: hypothetical protein [unclassified Streptomyces]|uniref:hypothetical protein n=1 Tax=unclassified Streptomyces TaxID=2593676 RepID=UPI0028C4EEAD|nr:MULTISPECIES: hypothetical protein [unclassified Streptomyces]WNO77276.1 hypothetical protein RPQ07_23660 [Streptomyces sp. AM8-1-1]
METSANGGVRAPATSATTARHLPSQDCSAPPGGDGPDGGCDLVTVPARQGLEAVDILRRTAAPAVGPVLHDGECDTLGFLVPPGTADGWDMPGSACTQTAGRGLRIPAEPPVRGSGWLLPPGGADEVTDPEVLREALGEAARLIEAADSRR